MLAPCYGNFLTPHTISLTTHFTSSSRKGKAVRLSYDHKGSDHQEAKRITDLGGFMMNNRVNGVLAVTRSLGDCVMKEFVVGNPYTTETELGQGDDFMILACDGVSACSLHSILGSCINIWLAVGRMRRSRRRESGQGYHGSSRGQSEAA